MRGVCEGRVLEGVREGGGNVRRGVREEGVCRGSV